MFNADDIYPETVSGGGFFIVGVTETCQRLAVCATAEQAAEFISTLPDHEDGIYYIDGPCTEPVIGLDA